MICCDRKEKVLEEIKNDDFVPFSEVEGVLNLSTTRG